MIVTYEATEIDGSLVLRNSKGDISTTGVASQLNLILNQYQDNQDEVDRLAWDLDTCLTPIFRNLVPAQAEALWKTHRTRVQAGGFTYELFYIPSKLFSVDRKSHGRSERATLYYLGQFFPDDVDEPKTALEAVPYGMLLRKRLDEKGFRTHRLSSPIAIFATEELESLNLPRVHWDNQANRLINDSGVPLKAQKYAAMCGGRIWVEAIRLGLFEHVDHWDLRSAFSTAASQLQDTRECTWSNCRGIPADACMGVARARITINPDVLISPILLPREHDVDCSPVGTWENFIMLPDIRFIRKYDIGKVEILDGWWGIPTRLKKPLKFEYDKLIKWRGEDRWADNICKRFLNGIYGKALERYDDGKLGPFWNGMWGATINSEIACKVGACIYDHKCQDSVTQIGVDSFSVTTPITLTDAEKLEWKLVHSGPQLAISSGMIFEAQKRPHGWMLDDLVAEMRKFPDRHRYVRPAYRRLTLGDAVQKGDYSCIGRMAEVEAVVDLSIKHDRIFPECPRTGGELLAATYSSVPLRVQNKKEVAP